MLRKKLIPGCGSIMYNAVGDVRYLIFTNLNLNAHPLRNKFVISEAEAVLIDFNGKVWIVECYAVHPRYGSSINSSFLRK
jgi:hypothetical protein